MGEACVEGSWEEVSLGGGDVERDEAEGEEEPGHGACFLL